MKIPPKKPHFFKPILPGFKNGIKIPVGFLKYLKGYEHIKRAVLKRGDKKCRIKVNEHRFEEDNWGKFVVENDLQLGYLLVFRHEGNMEFEVSVFDSSHCDREYEEYLQVEGERGAPSVEEISKKLEFKDLRANASLQLEGKKSNLDAKKVSSRRIRATVPESTSANANSQFVSIIHPYTMGRSVFFLPPAFARLNGLMGHCKMMLRDERQRLWPVKIGEVGPRFAIKKGWRQFREANAVQVGDSYKFELIDNGIIPIVYFHRVRANTLFPEGKKPNFDTKRVSTLANASTQFISTIRPYCIRKCCFYLPLAFAKLNGLVNRRCKMILWDEKQRPWAVWLAPVGTHIAISRGWPRFRDANDVQVGDTYKLELIDNGTIPVLYFHCKYSGKDAKASEKPLTNTNQQLIFWEGVLDGLVKRSIGGDALDILLVA